MVQISDYEANIASVALKTMQQIGLRLKDRLGEEEVAVTQDALGEVIHSIDSQIQENMRNGMEGN